MDPPRPLHPLGVFSCFQLSPQTHPFHPLFPQPEGASFAHRFPTHHQLIHGDSRGARRCCDAGVGVLAFQSLSPSPSSGSMGPAASESLPTPGALGVRLFLPREPSNVAAVEVWRTSPLCPQLRAFPLVHSCLNGRNQLPVSDTSGTKSSSFGALTFLFLDEQAWIAGPIFLPSWGLKAQDRPGSLEKGSPLAFHLLSSMLASHQEI